MITKSSKQNASKLTTSKPLLQQTEDAQPNTQLLKRAKSYNNPVISRIMDALFDNTINLVAEQNSQGTITYGVNLPVAIRSELYRFLGEEYYLELLEFMLPYVDQACDKTFVGLDQWLGDKYSKAQTTKKTIAKVQADVVWYNNALKQQGKKDLNYFLCEILLENNFIDELLKLITAKKADDYKASKKEPVNEN